MTDQTRREREERRREPEEAPTAMERMRRHYDRTEERLARRPPMDRRDERRLRNEPEEADDE